ncbi:MAG: bifunctional diguanylate cyclase/phosphodiesterase [Campylobacterota bacterium]|nr:bifunctional diguanylate cyclase/phosphodiesterase [Campylobacterota bacterium]
MYLSFTATPLIVIFLLFAASLFLLYAIYKKLRSGSSKYSKFSRNLTQTSKTRKSSENYSEGILIIEESGEVLFSNKSSAEMLGIEQGFDAKALSAAVVMEVGKGDLINLYDFLEIYQDQVSSANEYVVRGRIVKPEEELSIKIFLGSGAHPSPCYIIAMSNLSMEQEISSFRYKDMLTRLPNQNRAIYDIGTEISKMQAEERCFALMLVSIDNFTELRAMLGYQKTDNLISKISDHLQYIIKGMDGKIYHMMRNNFLLQVLDIDKEEETRAIVKKIENSLTELFDYSGSRLPLTFSTGISFFPKSGTNVDILIDSAYKALSEAKKQGNGYTVADKEGLFSKDKLYEAELYNQMQDALKNGEFELYYQPLIAMANDLVWGAEALIRWNHPVRGMVSPAEFIPFAEKTGLIVELGRFVIDEAIKQQKKWEIFKFNKIQVSINLSFREIETGEVVDFISKTLTRHQVSPALVKFEITENAAMLDPEGIVREFERLKSMGVQLALDDFGTGYSSFAYLKDFSLDTLKIDQSFVTDMVHNSEHQKIVLAMIGLGHNFDLQITAEGIEDEATYNMLKEFGCDIAQGYYFSKPLPVFEFQELIRRNKSKKASEK